MSGAHFAAGLLSSMSREYGEQQRQETSREEDERAQMSHVLDVALHSPDLDPRSYPALISKMLELQGAKGKEIESVAGAVRMLFGQGAGYQPSRVGQPVKRVDGSSLQVPGAPQTYSQGDSSFQMEAPPEMNYRAAKGSPGIRLLSPGEQRDREVSDYVAKRNAQEVYDAHADERRQARELAVAEAKGKERAQTAQVKFQNALTLVDKKDQQAETIKVRQLAQAYFRSGRAQTMEEAQAIAAETVTADIESRLAYRGAQTDVAKKRAEAIPQQIEQGWQALKLKEQSLLSSGAGQGHNTAVYNALARPEYNKIAALRQQINTIINNSGGEPDADEQKQLESLNTQISESMKKIEGLQQTHLLSARVPEVPGVVRQPAKTYAGRRISRAKIGIATTRPGTPTYGMTQAQAEQWLKGQGAIIY